MTNNPELHMELGKLHRFSVAFTIFTQYTNDDRLDADWRAIYVGVDPAIVTTEHLTELVSLGWHPSAMWENGTRRPCFEYTLDSF